MIQIRNIDPVARVAFSTSNEEGTGRPVQISLGPGDITFIEQVQLSKWTVTAKVRLAALVGSGSLSVNLLDSTHIYPDRSKRLTFTAIDLASALTDAINFKVEYNVHIGNSAYHTIADATNPITSADPVDLSTLVTLLTEAQTDYDAHIILAASHPFTDLINGTALATPTDLPTSLAVLEELVRKLRGHKLHKVTDGTDALSPIEVIAFT